MKKNKQEKGYIELYILMAIMLISVFVIQVIFKIQTTLLWINQQLEIVHKHK